MRTLFLPALLVARCLAQQVVAPTPETVGPARGENVDNYNVTDSFETGYRFALIGGDLGKYRSDVNYRNGIRLLGSNLSINSRDGHGRWFDEILLNTIGLGNDPYESAMLRVQKNGLYRYDMLWRMDEFYNPALYISAGEHLMDTRRRLQDHDLTLFPQARFRVRFGYSRNVQDGPALSSIQEFDDRGDIFPLFANVRRQNNEYRLGADGEIAGFRITVLHRWDDFKEDTPFALGGSTAGNDPTDLTTLTNFRRNEPYHGTSPGWLGNIFSRRKFWAVNGRFTYVGGRRNFILDEAAAGTDRFGAAMNRQVLVTGDARRPVTNGDFSLSLYPGRFTIVNNTSYHSTRIDGDASYTEFDNATGQSATVNFRYLGIHTLANATDVNFRAANWFGIYAGYHYSARHIRSIESFSLPGESAESDLYDQDNHLHSGLLGFRLKPLKPVTLKVDAEIGRSDHPLSPIADRNYHAIDARLEYRTRKVVLSTAYRQNYNNNSVALSTHSARARNYSANASWSPRDRFGFDASYTKLHLDTVSGIAFFAALPRPTLVSGLDSIYVSNIHAANLGARFGITKRADLYAGYTITRDTGDGRAAALPFGIHTDPVQVPFIGVQTFPLSFQSPLARLSIRISPKLRWNAGWQFYRYREDFGLFNTFQNYRANTGYTSVLWSF